VDGWALFTGLALLMMGTASFLRGLNLSSYEQEKLDVIGIENPDTWAIVFMVVGVIVIAAGFGAFTRARWARYGGMLGVFVSAAVNGFFLMSDIVNGSGITLILNFVVLYGLTVKWPDGGASA
jgi:hypothetical protein